MQTNLPLPGEVLSNQELTSRFQVGNMGGMRRSKAMNCLVLISDPFKAKYQDKWIGNVLHYTGMGQRGSQSFSHQNKTLRDAKELGIAVHLFEAFVPQSYTYLGEAELTSQIYTEKQPDVDGLIREVLMFPLRLKGSEALVASPRIIQQKEEILSTAAKKRDLDELRNRVTHAKGKPSIRNTTSTTFERNQDIVEYVRRYANGICQLCETPAPFLGKNGEPYLEVHHIHWLAKGGDDVVENTIALCPNCHRKMHVVENDNDIRKLSEIAHHMANDTKGLK